MAKQKNCQKFPNTQISQFPTVLWVPWLTVSIPVCGFFDRQVLVGVVVGMVTVSASASSAGAVMLPQLMANTSDITVSSLQGTWFGMLLLAKQRFGHLPSD